MRGSATSAPPSSILGPGRWENTPSGNPHAATARAMARATSSPVPGCAGWPLTTTGHPAARAEAVSPPATEKASGKFDAPNTATGPSATFARRRSGRGSGWRSGLRGIDRRIEPVALPDDVREQAQLAHRPPALALQPRARQARFLHRPHDQIVADRADRIGHRIEEGGATIRLERSEIIRRTFRQRAGPLDLNRPGAGEVRLDLRARRRVHRPEDRGVLLLCPADQDRSRDHAAPFSMPVVIPVAVRMPKIA